MIILNLIFSLAIFLLSLLCLLIFGKKIKTNSTRVAASFALIIIILVVSAGCLYCQEYFSFLILGILFFLLNIICAKFFCVWNSLAKLFYSSVIYLMISIFLYLIFFLVDDLGLFEELMLILILIIFVFEAMLCAAEIFIQMNSMFRIKNMRISNPWKESLKKYPKVSIHIPTRTEPPEMVIETLEGLDRLDYPNYEVIVVDNGTDQESLWRPVETYCKKKGGKFKFYHVGNLPGFKAEALNIALKYAAKDTEIIGVADADYLVAPEYLKETIGYFEDEKVAIVQAPQSFRGWHRSEYFIACFWVYRYFFAINMISNNMDNAASFMGTMGLIRKNILEDVGEWNEKSITEDIEIGFRVHAKGYKSIYVDKAFGKGFIPDEFKGYKKQRERWTFGNIQVLRHHLKKILPGVKSGLNFWQKINYFAAISIWLNFLLPTLIILLVMTFMYNIGYSFSLPLLFGIIFITGSYIFRKTFGFLFVLKNLTRQKFSSMFRAMISFYSLTLIMAYATLDGLIKKEGVFWRTSKFKHKPNLRDNWKYGIRELIIVIICLILMTTSLIFVKENETWWLVGLLILYTLIFSTTIYSLILNILEQGHDK